MVDNILIDCRQRFGPAPRRFSWYLRYTYLFTARPIWMRLKKDDLELFFQNRDELLSEGIIVWAHIVQANSLMFQRHPGSSGGPNCPGEVIYCIDPDSDINPGTLGRIAHSLFDMKGTTQDGQVDQEFADYLADERIRVYGKRVPSALSENYDCRVSTVFFERKHLPGNCLMKPFFPLLLLRNQPRVVMPLPSQYWPERFEQWWRTPIGA